MAAAWPDFATFESERRFRLARLTQEKDLISKRPLDVFNQEAILSERSRQVAVIFTVRDLNWPPF
jgi:hypothetical protein